jgi:hypothetical protein
MTMYRKSAVKNHLQPVRSAPFGDHYLEEDLEALLEQNPGVLAEGEPLLIFSRQPNAQESGTPDLLAFDADGNVVIVELKRGRPPRDVIAQALEYAAWASGLDEEAVRTLAAVYLARQEPGTTLPTAWQEAFGQSASYDDESPPALPQLNRRQRVVLVLEGRDDRVRSVVDYLRKHGIDINIVEYLYYRTESGEEFLDIEAAHTPQETSARLQPSETSLLAEWPADAGEAYRAFRDSLITADDRIQVEPKKTGISFYKQVRDGRVFLGTIAPSRGGMRIWFRRDSLQDRLDLEEMEQAITANMPAGIGFQQTGENDHRFDFAARGEDGRVVARLILDHIANELD